MSVTWDNREHAAIKIATDRNLAFTTESLEMGDILIRTETETLVFERKTVADLSASIKDGRFREQKQRLLSHFPNHRITYIIEGTYKSIMRTTPLHGLQASAYISSVLSLLYRDGCHVVMVPSTEDTVTFVYEIAERMITHPEKIKYANKVDEETYASSLVVKSKKGDNLTPELCYHMQLSQIPGISMKLAKEIAAVYPNFSSLLQSVQEKKVKAFTDIDGIGSKKAQTIIDYLQ
jgi:ERCC4-type nuclease